MDHPTPVPSRPRFFDASEAAFFDASEAARMAAYLRLLDPAGLARLAGALQAECTARSILAAIAPAGAAASALEDFARERR